MGQPLKKDEMFEEDFDNESVGELTLASAEECTEFFKSESTSTQTNRENEIDVNEEELSSQGLTLDYDKEFLKEALKNTKTASAPKIIKSENDLNIDKENEHLKSIKSGKPSGAIKTAGGKKVVEDAVFENVKKFESLVDQIAKDPLFTNTGDQYPQINGNYFLLDHLVDGGMAKICRARYLADSATAGADKLVVLKMVQEKFSKDPEYEIMFLDEIKVSFGLQHPNISTTFDYGKIGSNLFVSMEYIHGKDLKILVDKLAAKKQVLPFEITLYIISKMCEGLHYAHNFSDQLTGQSYNIVHRDISPHNVMVSFDGYVKVIDFGIAKADTNEQIEQEGTVKGKINYFAPEYLEGKNIDHRYDQFAIGLTFWELLTGKKTFDEKDQIKTIKAIFDCHPRKPSQLNPLIPKEIEAIVMKTLSRDPKDRYQDLSELNRDITALIHKIAPGLNQNDLSEFMKLMFKKDFEEDLKTFVSFGDYKVEEIKDKINKYKEYQKSLESQDDTKGNFVNLDLGFATLETSLVDKKESKSEKSKKKKKDNLQKALMGLVEVANSEEVGPLIKDKKAKKNYENLIMAVCVVAFIGFYKRSAIIKYFSKEEVEITKAQVAIDPIAENEVSAESEVSIKSDLKEIDSIIKKIEEKKSLGVIKFKLSNPVQSNLSYEFSDVQQTVSLMNGVSQIPKPQRTIASDEKSDGIEDLKKQKLIEEMKSKLEVKEKIIEQAINKDSNPVMDWISKRKVYKLFFD